MDYQEFVQEVLNLEFVRDEAMAEKAIKTVLGVVASKLEEDQAVKLSEALPHPLDLDELRNYKIESLPIPVEETIEAMGVHLNLDHEQGRTLVNTVLHLAKKSMGDSAVTEIERDLPMDWILVLEKA